ncbi:hypothetical protein [Nocardioides sp.]|uniref:hypothetical protein n=1 Tax=Nocardioides sp. TaxID=35761 RepID=UPI0019CC038C|nr:hypothetical protein [Nocardioides sp.]MBC7277796.1 hypothetical protein [Nocardioides sp.]
MKFTDSYFSREDRFSLGIEEETGRFYASIPVSNGVVDYEEYYELTKEQYDTYLAAPSTAVSFIEDCRRRKHDALLIQKPGWNRGTPV